MKAGKNKVLESMIDLLATQKERLIVANQLDIDAYEGGDQAMYDRLIIDDKKMDGMIRSVKTVLEKPDPVGKLRYDYQHPNGMRIENRTAPFGSILIIYESRPDVTIEAAVLAFKAGNKILLKGGKEARYSNLALVDLWHKALEQNGFDKSYIQYLNYARPETQAFLKKPHLPVDLIVPRGGERLIQFVKEHAEVPVLVSGRGNNFLYIHSEADWGKVLPVVMNAKTDKISACNALDKILVDQRLPHIKERLRELVSQLKAAGVQMLADEGAGSYLVEKSVETLDDEQTWFEEFLAMKIVIGLVGGLDQAIEKINHYSGGHSASILTEDQDSAERFMFKVDAAAVYHNASTRFTDGGEFGLGAELAISTDKLHQRGPLGLEHLVTNKWFVFGSGQVR